ncbi:MAG: T9SS type A sorting domain-containing protein, partial [Chitinophagaceae bacterium]
TEDYTVVIAAPNASRSNLLTANDVIPRNNALEIFPNPVSDILYIKGISIDKRSNQFIEIYDMNGRKLRVNNISQNSVNVSALKTGAYFIRIKQNSATIYSGRFIKK